ncbi:16S rRNA methyltransferase [Paenibacillus swuensis]|uniref:Ribosomal RNA small subunit methyltransferase E n=1 Tax=Paenibacillus swuensis TaxID=1178515 RepID=A0A172TJT8_9BACL|nr:16S rRNA (uracil(1498)-N(3))-methyltransferase [Paenibacillus swuensis]ANE47298.1 16S rRNA methyltransferase [Paenibacillus swuensis]
MQRYFLKKEQFTHNNTVRITGDDAHHLVKVMRARAGDKVICSDGESREALVELQEIETGQVTASIIEELAMDAEPEVKVWVAQSLPKGDKMEIVIQKCTEIGAHRFIPFESERTVVQYDAKKEAKRLERWNKIAKEAAEQAHRNRVPEVEPMRSWKSLLQLSADFDLTMICYEKEQGLQFRALLQQAVQQDQMKKVLLLIGPEGGFTENEVEQAEAAGARAISLGRRILRTETAAMTALTCILYETGEMGGN